MSTIPPEELTAAVEARRELGPEHDDAVTAAFLARVERDIEARVDRRLAARERGGSRAGGSGFLLAVVTLALLVPIAEKTTTAGFALAALAIVLVNVAYNLRR